MADRLTPVPEGGFKDESRFRIWLGLLAGDRAHPVAQVLSCRAALRVLPNLHEAFTGFKKAPSAPKQLIFASLRANLISRVAHKYPTPEIANAADSATHYTVDSADHSAALSANSAANSIARSVHSADHSALLSANSSRSAARSAALFAGSTAGSALSKSYSIAFSAAASDIWNTITIDAHALFSGTTPFELLTTPLWPQNDTPAWYEKAHERFQARLQLLDRDALRETNQSGRWSTWIQWYNNLIRGRPPWGLPSEAAWELERRIALGDSRGEAFWDHEPEEVNREIAEWVDEARKKQSNSKGPVFISYTVNDKADTTRIGRIIEATGFDVFAQYKDMPPGSNFITEMNKGLDGMGKFVPVYSPDYVTSKACAAEWNAAFNMDRDGERRLIIGFMLRPATLPPLYRQIVHVPLYNLTEPQLRDAVRDALIWDGEKYGPARSREIAAEAALPAPTINMQGQIDVEASPLEAPFIDDDLARLPESMRRHIETLLEALEGSNCSKLLPRSLKNYLLELTVHGATPNLPDLIRAAELIENARLDAEEDGESWYKRGSKTALDQFAAMHEQLKQHFPLIMLRDISIDRTSIEANRFDEEEFGRTHEAFTEAARQAHEAGSMTDDYFAVTELRERQRRDIESLRAKPQPDPDTVFLHPADRKTPDDIKKRFLFDVSGSSDKLLSKTAQATQIADSDSIKGLVKAAGDLLKSIWG